MLGRFLKGYMPRSLYGRAALIVLVPVLSILTVMSVVFIQRLYEDVTRQMTSGVADEVRYIAEVIDAAPDATTARAMADEIASALDMGLTWTNAGLEARREWIDLSGLTVRATLEERLPGLVAVDLVGVDGRTQLLHETDRGPVLLDIARGRLSPRNPHQFLVLIGVTAFLMTAIALLYLRGQVRPIRRLAAAASAFGKGRRVQYRPTGATEVREAGDAFLEMRDRIERQIEQRTVMLSGVSHDLRTPLTRMKLALSLMDEGPERRALETDVTEMEMMLNAFLDFAKGAAHENAETVSLGEIVEQAVDRARRAGQPIETGPVPQDVMLKTHPHALARAIDNLVGNAVRYGKRARMTAEDLGDRIVFAVEDDGPGIAPELRAEAVKPFSRLDSARNQDDGSGVGLGLAIAADIARQHGGRLSLGDARELTGLRAEIILPK
ncbi:HAMP domain-containing protein [Alphaproteobacteria bacterium GH1-50]|uniref:histidine kinase n=1 Tax=Kangsaoukella pontilimi TaxID=2691042 RepID=A0A7C9NDI3_9RHOB|nr:ATP-binding protein [Kangsaoukella pontilimi]MXQ07519.1 HAMP domain-containing protein [Kangsaoukella pontilimi]